MGVEQTTVSGEYHVIVTERDAPRDGGPSQDDALARRKYICDEYGLEGVFNYEHTDSTWVLSRYLEENPSIRQDVHERLDSQLDQSRDPRIDGSLVGDLVRAVEA